MLWTRFVSVPWTSVIRKLLEEFVSCFKIALTKIPRVIKVDLCRDKRVKWPTPTYRFLCKWKNCVICRDHNNATVTIGMLSSCAIAVILKPTQRKRGGGGEYSLKFWAEKCEWSPKSLTITHLYTLFQDRHRKKKLSVTCSEITILETVVFF